MRELEGFSYGGSIYIYMQWFQLYAVFCVGLNTSLKLKLEKGQGQNLSVARTGTEGCQRGPGAAGEIEAGNNVKTSGDQ